MVAVLQVNYPSSRSQFPFVLNLREGIPKIIVCGSFQSVPRASVEWRYQVNESFQLIDPKIAVETTNGSLFFIEPKIDQSRRVYRCKISNSWLSVENFGFFQINILSKYRPALILILCCDVLVVILSKCTLNNSF